MRIMNIKSKKGFSITECVIALLLCSIVIGSVLTVYASSNSQIKKQNDKYRVDLMANNITAAFEGSNNDTDFSNTLSPLGISIDPSYSEYVSGGSTDPNGLSGEFGFDPSDIPLAINFNKLVVKDGLATFKDDSGNDIISFSGEYSDNKLNSESFAWNELYNESSPIMALGSMTLTGTVNIDGISGDTTYTYIIANGKTKLICDNDSAGPQEGEKEMSDFEYYLLKNGYYLKCIYRDYSRGSIIGTTYDNFYFQVYNAANNQPITDASGKCLYYNIKIATNDEVDKYFQGLYVNIPNESYMGGGPVKMYFDFSNITTSGKTKEGSIKYGYAANGTSYNKISFSYKLTNDDGSKFTGNWFYYPWLVANSGTMQSTLGVPRTSGGVPKMTVECPENGYIPNSNYYEYTAKDDVTGDICYALNKEDNTEIFLFNSDGEMIFPYAGATDNIVTYLETHNEFQNYSKGVYNGDVYDKWYKRGFISMEPLEKVKFFDSTAQIIFYRDGSDAPYITFTYADSEKYNSDKKSVTDIGDEFADQYYYTRIYNKPLQTITNVSGLASYKNTDEITSKITDPAESTQKLTYYVYQGYTRKKVGREYEYTHKFEYYTYTVKLELGTELASFQETEHSLTELRNGPVNSFEEIIKADVTYNDYVRVTDVKPIASKKTETVSNKSSSRPALPDVLSGGKEVDQFRKTHTVRDSWISSHEEVDYDYSDKAWVKTNEADTNVDWNKTDLSYSTYEYNNTDTVNTQAEYDAYWNGSSGWNLASDTDICVFGENRMLYLFEKTEYSGFEVSIGNEETNTLIFRANTDDFNMAVNGNFANASSYTYSIDKAAVNTQTCYFIWAPSEESDMCLAVAVTYSDYTKQIDTMTNTEPRLTIWYMPKKDKQTKEPMTIDKLKSMYRDPEEYEANQQYLYSIYRKG